VPEISRFYGIVILMFYNDHSPPHLHAWYGEYRAMVTLNKLDVRGHMPGRALQMILEWMQLHAHELEDLWEKAQNGEPLYNIEPLK
jgi:hypothetical protein